MLYHVKLSYAGNHKTQMGNTTYSYNSRECLVESTSIEQAAFDLLYVFEKETDDYDRSKYTIEDVKLVGF